MKVTNIEAEGGNHMPNLNKSYICSISDELPYIRDYIPSLLRTKWFEYRLWIDNIEEFCSATDEVSIRRRLSKSTLFSEQEKMQELITWLDNYPQYKDVLIW